MNKPTTYKLYSQDLARRLLAIIAEKRQADKHNRRGFNLKKLSAQSGIPYWTLIDYCTRQTVALTLQQMDKILYAMGLSVLDLIEPKELADRYDSYDRVSRYLIRRKSASGIPPSEK